MRALHFFSWLEEGECPCKYVGNSSIPSSAVVDVFKSQYCDPLSCNRFYIVGTSFAFELLEGGYLHFGVVFVYGKSVCSEVWWESGKTLREMPLCLPCCFISFKPLATSTVVSMSSDAVLDTSYEGHDLPWTTNFSAASFVLENGC